MCIRDSHRRGRGCDCPRSGGGTDGGLQRRRRLARGVSGDARAGAAGPGQGGRAATIGAVAVKTFAHYSPETLKEASELLVAHRGAGRVNAGGTDLLGVLKDDIHPDYPEALISLKRIPGLDTIDLREGELSIGCMARIADLARVADDGFALIQQAARSVAGPQIRAVGTAGGNLCREVR